MGMDEVHLRSDSIKAWNEGDAICQDVREICNKSISVRDKECDIGRKNGDVGKDVCSEERDTNLLVKRLWGEMKLEVLQYR
jgi:hypothetical protein